MTTRLDQTAPVQEFATAIGEWLLARRFGSVTPLAFRWRLWEAYYEDDLVPTHVVMDLLVNDPPPPSAEWLALSEEERRARPIREWASNRTWPLEDRRALNEAAEARARAIGVPDGLDTVMPVMVMLRGRTEAEKHGMRFPQVEESAALRGEESARLAPR